MFVILTKAAHLFNMKKTALCFLNRIEPIICPPALLSPVTQVILVAPVDQQYTLEIPFILLFLIYFSSIEIYISQVSLAQG